MQMNYKWSNTIEVVFYERQVEVSRISCICRYIIEILCSEKLMFLLKIFIKKEFYFC